MHARLMKWMKSAIQALWVLVLAGALGMSALACPLWISMDGMGDMPCSGQGGCPKSCPDAICQIDSPYLTTPNQAFDTPALHASVIEAVDIEPVWITILASAWRRAEDGPPPSASAPLYLRTHSFLI